MNNIELTTFDILTTKLAKLENKSRLVKEEVESLKSELIILSHIDPKVAGTFDIMTKKYKLSFIVKTRNTINEEKVNGDWLNMDANLQKIFPLTHKLDTKGYKSLKEVDKYAKILPDYVIEKTVKPVVQIH